MSKRFLVLTAVFFVICTGIMIVAAFNFGADPFHERSRHIWAMSLIAAAYASIRISMIVSRYLDAKELENGTSYWTGLGVFGKKDHAIDRRLAERRARVDAAQKRANETEDVNKETGDE